MGDKPVTAWAVLNKGGHILTSTIAPLRAGSIRRMVGPEEGWRKRWRYWKRTHGCRCVRVIVAEEIKP